MNLTQGQIQFLTDNKNIILATSTNNTPRAIMVIPSTIEADRIVISNIQMETSCENIRNNPNVFLVSYNKDNSKWMKISGVAEMFSNGDFFNEIVALESTRCPMPVKEIIVIKIQSVVFGEE
ncbi:hypothetical protein FACS1894186_3570 [Alphaproteobacteria bacterium]|nr:hypothetical protein FACS1894186_3570 [Alphaproteobacteria bacterium]